jgi:hypothetical protein
MRTKEEHLRAIHRRVAQVAIGPSSLRNQGAPGVVDAARSYFEERIRLEAFAKALPLERTYQRWLDGHTQGLLRHFPKGAQHWGAARKALNLFARDVCYNTLLAGELGLPRSIAGFNRAIQWLEVPLDKDVALRHPERGFITAQVARHPVCDSRCEHAVPTSCASAGIQLDLVLWRASAST